MRVITRNGKILATDDGKALARAVPYGLYQAEQWNAVDLYEHILGAFEDGFARISNPEAASDYMEGLFKLPVSLSSFDLDDNANNRALIHHTIVNVAADHPLLCYNVNMTQMTGGTVYNGYTITTDGSKITGFWIYAPSDELRAAARAQTLAAIEAAKACVLEKTTAKYGGLTTRNVDTAEKKRDVTKILHDWIMQRTHYAETTDYWCKTAYAALVDDTFYPVCVGYAQALSYLCRLYRINCVYVEGSTDTTHPDYITHAWNMISFELSYGAYPNQPSEWAAIDLTYDDGRQDVGREEMWAYFCTSKTYHHNLSTPNVVTRVNSAKGYPVSVPTAYYPYYGTEMYGIAEADWIANAPEIETQGGDAS